MQFQELCQLTFFLRGRSSGQQSITIPSSETELEERGADWGEYALGGGDGVDLQEAELLLLPGEVLVYENAGKDTLISIWRRRRGLHLNSFIIAVFQIQSIIIYKNTTNWFVEGINLYISLKSKKVFWYTFHPNEEIVNYSRTRLISRYRQWKISTYML